jgi:hypothetical protein
VPLAASPATAAVQAAMGAVVPSAVAAVDRKLAEVAAHGPEYAAIAKLSREVIEQVVWEVVPELAEVIIREQVREHVQRLANAKH